MREPWYLINYGSNTNKFRTFDYPYLNLMSMMSSKDFF